MNNKALFEKIKIKKKEIAKGLIISAIVILLMMLSFFIFRSQLKKMSEEETLIYVNEAAKRNAVALKEKIEGHMDMLRSMALVMGKQQDFDKDYWINELSGEELVSEFQRLGFLLPDGKGYSVDVYDVDFSDREYFKKSINGESYISDVIMDRTTGKPCVYYAVPIFKDNKVIASVALGIYTDEYKGMLDLSFFDNKAFSVVVDHSGQVVIHGEVGEDFGNQSNIFDGLNADKSDIEKMKENMDLGKASKIIFKYGIEEKHLIYTPVGIKDWYIVTLIPNDIIEMRSQSVQNEAILLAVAFTSVLLVLILYISIEQRKHMKENQINQNKLIKLSIAVEQSPVSIVITNLDGDIEYANKTACRITGYSMEELIGNNPSVLKSGDTSSDEYKELWEIISHGSEWRGIFHNKRKDGQFYWESAIIAPIINSENKIINYLAIKEDITEKKMIEDELLKFKTVSEQANYGICITDLEGILIYVNDTFAKMHRWSKEELLGQNLRIVHSSNESKHIDYIIHTIDNKGGLLAEKIDHITKEGMEFPTLMSAKLVLDSNGKSQFMSATIIDISELKEKDAEINKFNIAMKQSPVAFVITDVNGNILYANPAFENITGYTLEEVMGRSTNILKSGETSKELYEQLWKTIQSGKTWNGTWVNKKKNGENYNEKISITPIFDEYGKITSYLAVKEDVTELMKSEQNRIARKVAEKASQSKTAFLSNMSHEIRTPLNAIIGFSQSLQRDGSFTPKQTEQIYTILRSSEHLLKLINNILDLSKIESGRISVNNNEISLYDLLQDLKMMFRVQSESKNIQFDIIIGEDVPKHILSDEGKIRQLLINILGNSMKFTQKGGVTLKVSAKGEKDTNKLLLEFEIKDTGVGIAPEEIKNVFENFHQTKAGINAGGTGLGLSISKHFVELMGGRIDVESQLNKGTIFRVSLPIIEVEKSINDHIESYENVIGIQPGIGPFRVLIADDQVYNRNMLVDVLEPIGFQTRQASDGQEALDVFEKWQPHCILMDIRMPVMDGYEAIKRIKRTKIGQDTLVIAVTASIFEEEGKKVMVTGADLFLRKPIKLEELYKMLNSIKGLEYVYAERLESSNGADELELLTKENIKALSPETILEMGNAVKEGNTARLRELIHNIENENSFIAHKLSELVKGYEYEKLIELLCVEGE